MLWECLQAYFRFFCHIVYDVGCYGRVILLPFYFLFVVPCSTFLNYDEDVDILVEFNWK